MPHRHRVHAREIGQVRIYMTPGERRKNAGKGLKGFWSSRAPLYIEIIQAAKQDGLLNATAHHTHYGFSGGGQIEANLSELPNARLTLCVELIGPRDQLEQFCRQHGDILQDKVVVYKHLEHWEITSHALHVSEAPEADYTESDTLLRAEDEASEEPTSGPSS